MAWEQMKRRRKALVAEETGRMNMGKGVTWVLMEKKDEKYEKGKGKERKGKKRRGKHNREMNEGKKWLNIGKRVTWE